MIVITDEKNIVQQTALIPGTDLNIPDGGHGYFPVKEAVPMVGEKFIPDLELQPWLEGA